MLLLHLDVDERVVHVVAEAGRKHEVSQKAQDVMPGISMQLRTRRMKHPRRLQKQKEFSSAYVSQPSVLCKPEAATANQLQCCVSHDSMHMRLPLHDLSDGAQTLLPPENWLDLKDLSE